MGAEWYREIFFQNSSSSTSNGQELAYIYSSLLLTGPLLPNNPVLIREVSFSDREP